MSAEDEQERQRLRNEAMRVLDALYKTDRHKHDHYVGSFSEGFWQGYLFATRERSRRRLRGR